MRNQIWACALNGILFGLIKLFYEIVPAPMAELLYCTFLGFTVTYAVGAEWKKAGHYVCSLAVGLIWVAGYVGLEMVFWQFPLQAAISRAVSFGVVSFVIEGANLFFLPKTKGAVVPLQFAVVIGVFSQKCRHIPYVLTALFIGVAAALISKQIYKYFLPVKKK
ncbi:hypothetical protein B5E84_00980 [Lachnoclostridium sp. An14]|uniref:hypothetical protein n=1 Tax=Lachnoclostridium sp. An14 TaxID=1965562 RepID=UPI000B366631|nr:hypothetical protein [Lachnoclostridium sp. An14]OUQ21865.1 hypothetical protein B5E84_00980 [Lachnoclostridium sp. An14]